jgi:hypothetical protein
MPTLRRDNTSAGFISGNPVLAAGEHGYETDTEASKIGDGITAWAGLPYSGANPTLAALNATFAPLNAVQKIDSSGAQTPATFAVRYDANGDVDALVLNGVDL